MFPPIHFISYQRGEDVTISQNGRVLILHKVIPSQAGRYLCKAGSETKEFELTVLDRAEETVNFVLSSKSVQFYFKVVNSPESVKWFVFFSFVLWFS